MFLQKGTHNIQKWLKYIIQCIYFIAVLSSTSVMKHPAHAGPHAIKLLCWGVVMYEGDPKKTRFSLKNT